MKKIIIIFVGTTLILGSMLSPAAAQQGEVIIDTNGDMIHDTTIDINVGDTIDMEIWLLNADPGSTGGMLGVEWDMLFDSTSIALGTFVPFDTANGGPWDPSFSFGPIVITANDYKYNVAVSTPCVQGSNILLGTIGVTNISPWAISTLTAQGILLLNCAVESGTSVNSSQVTTWCGCCSLTIDPQNVTVVSQSPGSFIGPTFTGNSIYCETQEITFSDDCVSADVSPTTGVLIVHETFITEHCRVIVSDAANPDACNNSYADCYALITIEAVADFDSDGILNVEDNCPLTPNSPDLGTCVKAVSGVVMGTGVACIDNSTCEEGEICQLEQGDVNGNSIGDVCECYADCDNNTNVGLSDLGIMKTDFGRFNCNTIPCDADMDGNGNVGLSDLGVMKAQFGKFGCPVAP